MFPQLPDDLTLVIVGFLDAQSLGRICATNRRLRRAGDTTGSDGVISVAAHPGLTDTDLLAGSLRSRGGRWLVPLARAVNAVVTQRVERGMLPQLRAATDPGIEGGAYLGPGGPGETRGLPAPARLGGAAQDPAPAARLWDVTAAETGVPPDPA